MRRIAKGHMTMRLHVTRRTSMKRRMTVLLVAAAELFAGCASGIDRASAGDDDNVALLQEALWTEGCNDEQQSFITGATIGAYYALQSALQTYSTGSNRANHYFGVGYSDVGVQYRLLNIWDVMHDQDLTVVCQQDAGAC